MKSTVPEKTVYVFVTAGNVVALLGTAQNLGTEVFRISVLRLPEVAGNFDKNKHCFLTRQCDVQLCLEIFGKDYVAHAHSPEVYEIRPIEKSIKKIERSNFARKKTVYLADQLRFTSMVQIGKEKLKDG